MEEIDERDNESNKDKVQVVGNHIYLYSSITQEISLQVVKAIRSLNNTIKAINASNVFSGINNEYEDDEDTDSKISNTPIYLHINSLGGDFFSGMAIVDTVKKSKIPVYTIGEGGQKCSCVNLLSC